MIESGVARRLLASGGGSTVGGLLRLFVKVRGVRLRSSEARRLRGCRADWGRSVGRLGWTACHVAIMAACLCVGCESGGVWSGSTVGLVGRVDEGGVCMVLC